jgi:AraC-like DNA-binding protein
MSSHVEYHPTDAASESGWRPPMASATERLTTAQLLSSYSGVVSDLGGKPDVHLHDAGIDPDRIQRPGGKVTLLGMGQLLERTAQALGCPDVGLRLAERQSGPSIMHPLERLLSNAPTIGDSLQCCVDYVDVFNSGLVLNLERDADTSLYFLSLEFCAGISPFPQLTEQLLLLVHRYVGALSAGVARARMVSLSHPAIGARAAYAKRFCAPVRFGQQFDGLYFKESDIEAKVLHSNPEVFAVEHRRIASRFPPRPATIDQKVRQVIARALADSNCSRQHVAALMGIPERTLNRRLNQIGTTFEGLRDDVRRNLAHRYLVRGDLPLTEICARLNYSEMAVLSRSCQRWFGAPPNELRRRLSRLAPGSLTVS